MWTSLTLRRTMRMLTSVTPAFLKKRWNVPKTLAFFNWFGESHVTHRNKPSRTTSTKNNHSMHSAMSRSGAIMDAGNIEISEIVNAEPKWQCKSCLNHCNPGVIYCVCGRLMTKDSAENRKYISSILDSFSIPNFYIRKDRPRGHRYGKSQGCKEYFTANQLAKKCRKKRNMIASTTGASATRPSERQWSKSVALNKWLSRWTSLRTRTTVTKPAGKKSSSTVAIGGSTRIWHALIQYRQGMNPNLKVRCQQCSAWSEQKTKRSKKRWHKPLHPRLRGTGIQAGGSLITSTHLKNGMTADDTGKPVFWWFNTYLWEESQRAEEFRIFIVKIGYSWQQSTVTDGGCKGNVPCTSYSRTFGYGILTWTTWTTLRTMARTPQSTRTCTMRSSEHAAHRLLMHSVSHRTCGTRSRLVCYSMSSMHAHLCVVLWASLLTRLSTSLSCSSSSSTWCPTRRLTSSPSKIPCATPAWGAWSLWTMSHPSQKRKS